MAWSDPGRVVIGIGRAGRGNAESNRAVVCARAVADRRRQRRLAPVAEEADGGLLRSRERKRGLQVRDGPCDQPAVIPPRERRPWAVVWALVAHMCCLLECLVVIDAEDAGVQWRVKHQATIRWP